MKALLSGSSRWAAEHPKAVDAFFAVVLGALSIAGLVTADPSASERSADLFGAVLVGSQATAFAFRRRRPMTSFVVVVVATIVFWVSDFATNFDVFSILAVYSATAHGGPDRARVWRVVGLAVMAMSVIAVAGVLSPDVDLPAIAVVGVAAIHLTAAVAGELVHDRRLRVDELEQRALRAEAERELLARQAVSDERARIARDLHDVVAHGMSVMVVQAAAAERIVDADPVRAAEALGHIQAAGREALTEMRRMLDLLRDDTADGGKLIPQPSMDDLDRVVRHCNDSGVPTELVVSGELAQRSPGHEMAAYRIVQEALTNVIRHAGRPANAVVKVGYRPHAIEIEVLDDGRGAPDRDVARSTGHGIVGMRERVELYGGQLRVGARPGGGFRVAAVVPFDADRASPDRIERLTAS